jgi:S1-C subfamily serine protease
MNNNLPIATQWTLNATAALPSQVVLSVVLVVTTSTGQKGTGWLVSDRHVVTNEHVVHGGAAGTVRVQFSDAAVLNAQSIVVDALTDIAVITLDRVVSYTPLRVDRTIPDIGTRICAWGHPLGYNGPAPILSVGYVAGFNAHQPQGLPSPQRRLVLNAALNPGNSGGPIFAWGEQTVRGVAVTKHAPITQFLQSAIDALRNNSSGIVFTTTDGQGNTQQLVESQVVAEVLQYFRGMTQVVIGEAIAAEDVIAFLDKNRVPWQPA